MTIVCDPENAMWLAVPPPGIAARKFNQNHDPQTGEFTGGDFSGLSQSQQVDALRTGAISGEEDIANGEHVNTVHKALLTATVDGGKVTTPVIVKPRAGLGPFVYNVIPDGTNAQRSEAAYDVAGALGGLVDTPPAVARPNGDGVQSLVPGGPVVSFYSDPERLDPVEVQNAAIYDLIIGNQDRHGFNALITDEPVNGHKLHLIDNDLTFPDPTNLNPTYAPGDEYYEEPTAESIKAEADDAASNWKFEVGNAKTLSAAAQPFNYNPWPLGAAQRSAVQGFVNQRPTLEPKLAGLTSPYAASEVFTRAQWLLDTGTVPSDFRDVPTTLPSAFKP